MEISVRQVRPTITEGDKVFFLYGTCDTENTAKCVAETMKEKGFATQVKPHQGEPAVWTCPDWKPAEKEVSE
jgi:hypothetical protein